METPRTPPPYQKTKEESTPPNSLSLSLFLQWPSWTKIYVEGKTKKKERKNGKEKKEKIDR
jgi:hypothetical protein